MTARSQNVQLTPQDVQFTPKMYIAHPERTRGGATAMNHPIDRIVLHISDGQRRVVCPSE